MRQLSGGGLSVGLWVWFIRDKMYSYWGKRVFDVCFSLIALIVLSPIILCISFLILLFDPGPVIFKQNRVGRFGQSFVLFKFRSMPIDTDSIPSDQIGVIKISYIGRFIRRTCVDELPQLFNVLRGDMSIVGPRPSLTQQTELISLRFANGVSSCRPGLTGLAQINAFDGMSVVQKASLDARYAQEITLIQDVKIIFATFLYLIKPPPVY